MAAIDRRVTLDKILNFRDVGKYINNAANKQILREGVFFRSARPDSATSNDRRRLMNDFHIKTIIDLRTPTEHLEQSQKHVANTTEAAATAPSDPFNPLRIPEINYKDINFNGSGYSNALIWQLSYWNIAKLFSLYTFGYRKEAIGVLAQNVMAERGLDRLAKDSLLYCKAEVKQVFDVLCEPSSYPVLIHCTQGKDRTGLNVLLALLLCGVSKEAIASDYQLSESELKPEIEEKVAELRSVGLPESFAGCADGWVEEVGTYIEDTFGGVESYLESCGVTLERQKKLRGVLQAK